MSGFGQVGVQGSNPPATAQQLSPVKSGSFDFLVDWLPCHVCRSLNQPPRFLTAAPGQRPCWNCGKMQHIATVLADKGVMKTRFGSSTDINAFLETVQQHPVVRDLLAEAMSDLIKTAFYYFKGCHRELASAMCRAPLACHRVKCERDGRRTFSSGQPRKVRVQAITWAKVFMCDDPQAMQVSSWEPIPGVCCGAADGWSCINPHHFRPKTRKRKRRATGPQQAHSPAGTSPPSVAHLIDQWGGTQAAQLPPAFPTPALGQGFPAAPVAAAAAAVAPAAHIATAAAGHVPPYSAHGAPLPAPSMPATRSALVQEMLERRQRFGAAQFWHAVSDLATMFSCDGVAVTTGLPVAPQQLMLGDGASTAGAGPVATTRHSPSSSSVSGVRSYRDGADSDSAFEILTPSPTTVCFHPDRTRSCDDAPAETGSLRGSFVRDITLTSSTHAVRAGTAYRKSWEVKNSGTCDWPADTKLVKAGSEDQVFVGFVAAGESTEVTIVDVAPELAPGVSSTPLQAQWALAAGGKPIGVDLCVQLRVVQSDASSDEEPDQGEDDDFAPGMNCGP